MDLGLRDRKAIVCAASRGLGRACAMALATEGVSLVINARGRESLEATADAIRRSTGVTVTAVAADITRPEGRASVIAACREPDILVNNAGGPPPGDFRDWDREAWLTAIDANMLAPIELIKATIDGMIARGFGRIVNITSVSVKAPISYLGLSNGARSGLTGFVAGLARQVVRHNVTINNLLPGSFDTDRLRSLARDEAENEGRNLDDILARDRAALPSGRFGMPDELGAACAFLCGAEAGYITGQNLVLDGGNYPGTF
jgi:3-oxoacyl-[acyl-carrier protein] reductase